MPLIDLSFPIRPHFRWKVAREVRASHASGDNFESSIMTLGCHAYTHVDAPRHFLPGDRHIAEMPVDQWVGEAAVVDLTHLGDNAAVTAADLERHAGHVREGDIVLLRTDWPRRVNVEDERFWRDAPFTAADACHWLVRKRVKAVGYDYPPDFSVRTGIFEPTRKVPPRGLHDPLHLLSRGDHRRRVPHQPRSDRGRPAAASWPCPSPWKAPTAPRSGRSPSSTSRPVGALTASGGTPMLLPNTRLPGGGRWGMGEDEYSESLDSDFRKLEGALLNDTVRLLAPSEPIRLGPDATVRDAIERMVDQHRAAVVVVDADGRLVGIFTERDVLIRVLGEGRDPGTTPLGAVMTPQPEALAAQDRICFAVNRMSIAGFRTIPLVDAEGRPIGIITVNDVVKWLAEVFPEAVLNLRPGDRLKHPLQVDAG